MHSMVGMPTLLMFDWKNMEPEEKIWDWAQLTIPSGMFIQKQDFQKCMGVNRNERLGKESDGLTNGWKHLLTLCPSKSLVCNQLVKYDQIASKVHLSKLTECEEDEDSLGFILFSIFNESGSFRHSVSHSKVRLNRISNPVTTLTQTGHVWFRYPSNGLQR